eukprot:scaffold14562_cov60-Phaeocystis_antarctica.AAC.5
MVVPHAPLRSFSSASSASNSAAAAAALTSAVAVDRLACCRSTCAVAVCLWYSANMSAVLPSMLCSEASALASSINCTVEVWPLILACIKAVHPKLSCRLTPVTRSPPGVAVDDATAAGCDEALDALTDATASAKRTWTRAVWTYFAACIVVDESWSRGLGRKKRELQGRAATKTRCQ